MPTTNGNKKNAADFVEYSSFPRSLVVVFYDFMTFPRSLVVVFYDFMTTTTTTTTTTTGILGYLVKSMKKVESGRLTPQESAPQKKLR